MISNPQDRVEITRLIETWDKAFRLKDVAGLRSIWDSSYDDLIYQSEEFSKPLTSWKHIRNYYREVLTKLISEVHEVSRLSLGVNTIGDAGYAFGLARYKMEIQGMPQPYDATVRQTFGLRKTGQGWKVIHYHESVQTLETPPHFDLERDD